MRTGEHHRGYCLIQGYGNPCGTGTYDPYPSPALGLAPEVILALWLGWLFGQWLVDEDA